MKKIKILCAALLTIGLFTACRGASGGDNNPREEPEIRQSDEKAIAIYKKFIGTTWTKFHKNSTNYPETVIFLADSIIFDNESYYVNQNTDFSFNNNENRQIIFNNGNVKFRIYYFTDTFPLEIDYSGINIADMLDPDWNGSIYDGEYYQLSSNNSQQGGNNNGENETSVEGNYSFTASSGTEMSGSLTLSNGEWSYSGSNKPAATSGTYTVNGSKITVNWTANGLSLNETFTVTKNGNSVTWKSENEYTSTFLTMLFKVSATKLEVTFDYTE